MKVVEFAQTGPVDVLKLVERVKPEPGPGQVRLKITSVGLNRADALFRENRYFTKPTLPSRLGVEGAGIVDAVGAGVKVPVGARMAFMPNSFDISTQGCLAEYGVYDEQWLIPTPDFISDEQAGAIWMKYLTVWGALLLDSRIGKGDCVVIPAASSSVGIAAIQTVNAFGGISVATTTSSEKVEILKEMGAQVVINMKTEDYVKIVKDLTGGKGANYIFDPVAGPTIRDHIAATAPHAVIYLYGLLDRRPMDIHAGVMMKKWLTVKGYTFRILFDHPEMWHQAVEEITDLLRKGILKPVIAGSYKLDEVQDAFRFLESNRQIGKIIVTP